MYAYRWIRNHLEEHTDTCLPKQSVYDAYRWVEAGGGWVGGHRTSSLPLESSLPWTSLTS